MVNITLFELHVDDASLSATTPFGGSEKEVEAAAGSPEEDSGGKGGVVAAVVGLVFLVAVAYVARKKFTGEDEGEQLELDEAKV